MSVCVCASQNPRANRLRPLHSHRTLLLQSSSNSLSTNQLLQPRTHRDRHFPQAIHERSGGLITLYLEDELLAHRNPPLRVKVQLENRAVRNGPDVAQGRQSLEITLHGSWVSPNRVGDPIPEVAVADSVPVAQPLKGLDEPLAASNNYALFHGLHRPFVRTVEAISLQNVKIGAQTIFKICPEKI